MESAGLVVDALGRVRDMVRDALTDLSPEQLLAPPKPHIAWLVWNIARVQDANFSNLMDLPQLWIAGRWHERFNMPPDPRDYGSAHRHTQAQVYSAQFQHIFSPLILSAKGEVSRRSCHYS